MLHTTVEAHGRRGAPQVCSARALADHAARAERYAPRRSGVARRPSIVQHHQRLEDRTQVAMGVAAARGVFHHAFRQSWSTHATLWILDPTLSKSDGDHVHRT